MRVRADREQLGRHRQRLGRRSERARPIRRDVGPERAGVDKLTGEQSLDVRSGRAATTEPPAIGNHVRRRPAAVDQDRVWHRASDQQAPSPSSWRLRTAAARPAPPPNAISSPSVVITRRSASRQRQSVRRRARGARPRAYSRTRRRARRSWSGRPGASTPSRPTTDGHRRPASASRPAPDLEGSESDTDRFRSPSTTAALVLAPPMSSPIATDGWSGSASPPARELQLTVDQLHLGVSVAASDGRAGGNRLIERRHVLVAQLDLDRRHVLGEPLRTLGYRGSERCPSPSRAPTPARAGRE